MSYTIEKILGDARMLCTRLKGHDNAADILIEQAQGMHKKIEAMQTYQEDLNELNEIARHRPRANLIMGLVQESSQIRELQHENKELRLALEEHQSALELIMSKYREQVVKLVTVSKLDQMALKRSEQDQELEDKMNKICEMAAVMRQAIGIDDNQSQQYQEVIARLKHENKTLRELIQMAYINSPKPATRDEEIQTDNRDHAEDHENQNTIDMDDSYTSTDNSFDNPLQRSVIEVTTIKRNEQAGNDSNDLLDQDENANSSNASSDIDSEIVLNK